MSKVRPTLTPATHTHVARGGPIQFGRYIVLLYGGPQGGNHHLDPPEARAIAHALLAAADETEQAEANRVAVDRILAESKDQIVGYVVDVGSHHHDDDVRAGRKQCAECWAWSEANHG